MAWLNKLRNLFQTEPDLELIQASELLNWLKKEAQSILKKSEADILTYAKKLKDQRWMLECYLDEWEEKLKQESGLKIKREFNSGVNRKPDLRINQELSSKVNPELNSEIFALLLDTRVLLEQITFSENLSYERLLSLSRSLELAIGHLIQKVEASPFAHNFALLVSDNEREKITVNPLLKELLEMEGVRKDLELNLTRLGLRKIETIILKLERLEKMQLHWEELTMLAEHKMARKLAIEESKQEKEHDYLLLNNDSRYQEINKLDQSRSWLEAQMKQLVFEMAEYFADLRPLIRLKYLKITRGLENIKEVEIPEDLENTKNPDKAESMENTALLEQYASDPAAALTADEGLSIVHLLEYFKAALLSGQLELEADEAEKIFYRLQTTKANQLNQWSNAFFSLKKALHNLNAGFVYQDLLTKVQDARYRLDYFTEKLEQAQNELFRLNTKTSELKEKIIREKVHLQGLIRIGLNKPVEIVVNF